MSFCTARLSDDEDCNVAGLWLTSMLQPVLLQIRKKTVVINANYMPLSQCHVSSADPPDSVHQQIKIDTHPSTTPKRISASR